MGLMAEVQQTMFMHTIVSDRLTERSERMRRMDAILPPGWARTSPPPEPAHEEVD